MHVRHITTGQAGIEAADSTALATAMHLLATHGFTVSDIEDEADEPIHEAIVHYRGGPQTLRTLKELLAHV